MGRNQLELFAGEAGGVPTIPAEAREDEGEGEGTGEFAAFGALCDAIAASTGKLKKVELLGDYLSGLNEGSLALAVDFLSGRPMGRAGAVRALHVGWAVTRSALLQASGRSEAEYRELTRGQNDGGRAAFLLLQGRTRPEPASLTGIREAFEELAKARGPDLKTGILRDLLGRLHHREGQYVVVILSGDLRIGLKEGLIEEGLARAFNVPVADVRRAHMLLGDLGETARLACRGTLDQAEVTPFVPLQCMLASPEATAEGIWQRLGAEGGPVWLEDKFDGIRAQLHRVGNRVEIFSRDLRPLHGEFDEFIDPARGLPADVILDGEIIAHAEGKRLTFFDLQKRLGRRNETDLFFGPAVPVRFVLFDILWRDGVSLLDEPLRERRTVLEALEVELPLERLPVYRAGSVREIEDAFNAARRRDNEGLIAKDPESVYSPGRRGLAWLKLKKPMPTLDCVVVKVEEGHGKRSHVLSDYTFAVRDEASGALVEIGKAYTGLTDAEIEELTDHFVEHSVSRTRRARAVTPDVVLEIAFDALRPSKRHRSGLAMRFPRIVAIRRDKTVDDIDTLAYARKLAGARP